MLKKIAFSLVTVMGVASTGVGSVAAEPGEYVDSKCVADIELHIEWHEVYKDRIEDRIKVLEDKRDSLSGDLSTDDPTWTAKDLIAEKKAEYSDLYKENAALRAKQAHLLSQNPDAREILRGYLEGVTRDTLSEETKADLRRIGVTKSEMALLRAEILELEAQVATGKVDPALTDLDSRIADHRQTIAEYESIIKHANFKLAEAVDCERPGVKTTDQASTTDSTPASEVAVNDAAPAKEKAVAGSPAYTG